MFRANPAIYAFLGGIFVSMGMGFVSSVVTPSKFPDRWAVLFGAAGLAVVSGSLWTILGWRLDELQRVAIREAPSWVDDKSVWQNVIKPLKSRMIAFVILAMLTGIGACGILLLTSEGIPLLKEC